MKAAYCKPNFSAEFFFNFLGMFNILAYTDLDCTVPAAWEDGQEHFIEGAQQVKLKTVNTLIHKVDLDVCYKTT